LRFTWSFSVRLPRCTTLQDTIGNSLLNCRVCNIQVSCWLCFCSSCKVLFFGFVSVNSGGGFQWVFIDFLLTKELCKKGGGIPSKIFRGRHWIATPLHSLLCPYSYYFFVKIIQRNEIDWEEITSVCLYSINFNIFFHHLLVLYFTLMNFRGGFIRNETFFKVISRNFGEKN
jgi:hypothetical protein